MKIPPEVSFRSRVGYANEAIYVSKSATGYHFGNRTLYDTGCSLRNNPFDVCSGNLVRQLSRVQSINYGFTTTRVDANQFGQSARVASPMITSPEVKLDFEYLLADGFNERLMNFVIDGETSALANHISNSEGIGMNFFITTVEEGHDVIRNNLSKNQHNKTVIGFGNSYLSQYAITAQVGAIPRARVSYEAFNMRSYTGICNLPVPSLNPTLGKGECSDVRFSIPDVYKSFDCDCDANYMEDIVFCEGVTALRPGDIMIDLQSAGLFSEQLSGFDERSNELRGAAQIQGFTINVPLGNTRINRIGRNIEFTRAINFPASIDVQVNALAANLREASIGEEWFNVNQECRPHFDLKFDFNICGGVQCKNGSLTQVQKSMTVELKGAVITSENFSSSVSDSKTVSLNFSIPIASEDDKSRGIFMSGMCHIDERPLIMAFGNPL